MAKLELVKKFASTWAEPFKSFALSIPKGTEVKQINLSDWAPPEGLRGSGPVVLLGDAFHSMTMCKWRKVLHLKPKLTSGKTVDKVPTMPSPMFRILGE